MWKLICKKAPRRRFNHPKRSRQAWFPGASSRSSTGESLTPTNGMSCIPSAVEMVLKLMGRVPGSYYDQQDLWRDKADGSFHNFDGTTIAGITFHQRFTQAHGDQFPLADLFTAIDRELRAGRFVIIGLPGGDGTHDWVIYDEDTTGDFLAVSKGGPQTLENDHVRKTITDMKGTDIGTYDPP